MNLVEEYCEAFRQTFGALLPAPRKKREKFLEKVREKVDYYKPKIEAKCNISLRNVKVKDNEEWLDDHFSFERDNRRAIEIAWKNGRVPTQRDFRSICMASSLARTIVTIPLLIYNTFLDPDFRYGNDTIYVPFYYGNRLMDVDFERKAKNLDRKVVHELSHCLWDNIVGNKEDYSVGIREIRTYREWSEGFATYCESTYFSDIYPDSTEELHISSKVYRNGKRRIEELVKKHGEGILLEVPKRWKEFDKELSV